jgi:FkbM family methyltransferase
VTVRFSRTTSGFKGWLHSFEPLPSGYEKLAARAANHSRWKTHPFAVSKEKGSVDFNIMAGEEFSSIHAPDSAETTLFDNKNWTCRGLMPLL